MFKQIMTIFRGHTVNSVEQIIDANALVVLRQQIREGAESIQQARHSLALAMAQNQEEAAHGTKLAEQLADLETRAVAALEQNKVDLATEAAAMIANLEADHAASQKAQAHFAAEIKRQRAILRQAESRLQELERGLRLASVTDKTQRLTKAMPGTGASTLKDAERTLDRLKSRQLETDRTHAALVELDTNLNPETLRNRLADAACGPALKSSTDDVLKRLSARLHPTTQS